MINKSFNPVQTVDGTMMDIWVTFPDETNKHPAIILLNEGYGVDAHMQSVAERLCKEGYAVFAPDLFHRRGRQVQVPYNDYFGAMSYVESVTPECLDVDLRTTLIAIQSMRNVNREKIGALGFCQGGRYAFVANELLPLSAAVSYYAVGVDKIVSDASELHAPQLFFWGGRDNNVANGQIDHITDTLATKTKDFTSVVISHADHGFFCDDRPSYSPLAARQAWAHTLSFFDFLLK